MQKSEKVKRLESLRNQNHDLLTYRQWLTQAMPNHTRLQKIQVAGTNGKGSTALWLHDLLVANGWKVGLFSSPHLVEHTERIQINGQAISWDDWNRIYDQYESFFEQNQFTMFEVDCWMAIAYFLEQGVDMAIMEVGLGGRLDATTALDYNATLITNIALDHSEILGDSLEQIAFEKSGIFKPGVVALTTEKNPMCQEVMEHVAGYFQTPLGFVEMPYEKREEGIAFTWNDQDFLLKQPFYQLDNLALALECTAVLGIELKPETIQPVMDQFQHKGRCSILKKDPLLMVDGAHNVAGIQSLVQHLQTFDGTIYFGAMKEKDVPAMLESLKTLQADIQWVDFHEQREYNPESLGLPIVTSEEMMESISNQEQDILVCGSLYLIGQVIERFG